jgi:hypothetical protein
MLLPALQKTTEKTADSEARLRCAQMSLAVEQFRVRNRRLPERLEELVPGILSQLPVDPIDGDPLHYLKLDTGYVVYSVGLDGIDNGGLERGDSNRSNRDKKSARKNRDSGESVDSLRQALPGDPYDITFTVER